MSLFLFSDIDTIPSLIFNSKISQKIFDFQSLNSKLSEDSLLYQVANFYLKISDKNCPRCILCYFQRLMNPSKIQNIDILFKCSPKNIYEVHIRITYQQRSQNGNKEIQVISIIFPWAVKTLKSIHYLEVDGSFDGMKTYVYCIFQGVLFNESVPIAITIAPQECLELYNFFFDDINTINNNTIE